MNSSRIELFEKLEKPALMPLPVRRYEFLEWKTAKVGIDYHISADKHLYSVPYQLVGQQVDVRLSALTVEILYKNRRVASHRRSIMEGGVTTSPDHRPKSHQEHLEWTPSRIVNWAKQTGPATAALVKKIMTSRPHPEAGYRSCLGIIRLSKYYGKERVEAACLRGLRSNVTSYKSIKSILESGLDKVPVDSTPRHIVMTPHANVRGSEYYKRLKGE